MSHDWSRPETWPQVLEWGDRPPSPFVMIAQAVCARVLVREDPSLPPKLEPSCALVQERGPEFEDDARQIMKWLSAFIDWRDEPRSHAEIAADFPDLWNDEKELHSTEPTSG